MNASSAHRMTYEYGNDRPGAFSTVNSPTGQVFDLVGFLPISLSGNRVSEDRVKAVDVLSTTDPAMTYEFCSTFCVGYTYWAVGDGEIEMRVLEIILTNLGDDCSCFNNPPTGAPIISPSTSIPCPGNKDESCGSGRLAIVYKLDPSSPPATITPSALPTPSPSTKSPTSTVPSSSPASSVVGGGVSTNAPSVSIPIVSSSVPTPSDTDLTTKPASSTNTDAQSDETPQWTLTRQLIQVLRLMGSLQTSPPTYAIPPTSTGSPIDTGLPTDIIPPTDTGLATDTSLATDTGVPTVVPPTDTGSPSVVIASSDTGLPTVVPPTDTGSPSVVIASSDTGLPSVVVPSIVASPASSQPPVIASSAGADSSPTSPNLPFSSGAYAPISTPGSCPGDDGKSSQDILGVTYNINCDRTLNGNKIPALHADDLDACFQGCDMFDACKAVSFDKSGANVTSAANCVPYSTLTGYSSTELQDNIHVGFIQGDAYSGGEFQQNVCTDPDYGDDTDVTDSYGNTYHIRCGYILTGTTNLVPMAADSLFGCFSYCSLYLGCVGVVYTGDGPPAGPSDTNCQPVSAYTSSNSVTGQSSVAYFVPPQPS
ncbi:uncharacterized protein KY384_001435 [Bacidia gigantensis]|uniref:uncharacterized protein n=1 Tax=Bacidia gigantensis TaxID=2732470 RepID=UPI001D05C08E|nr:uncharacterized protein KY384_001435 [Bacidia gigantensis]KAG8533694.1 hypothetical protein KY384_001435 [Bacidia gigantensis]